MNTKILNKLQELNLSANESKVYLALLEIGQTSAGEIIRKTLLHRSVVYETLDKLIEKKLVFKLNKRSITYFQPNDPERILHNIKTQEEIALSLMPELKGLLSAKLPEIIVHEGIENWRKFWLDSTRNLPEGTIDYVAGSIGKRWQEIMAEDTSTFIRLRLKRKIKWHMIVFDKDELEFELLNKYPRLHKYRLIEKQVSSLGNFNIINDTLVLVSATEPMIVEIKNKTLAQVFKNLFDILWESGKEIK
ncbi:MAG TPA: helix-turn-helix domain-containing protein [bacterium]|nr:helix-turn-helix domain-containing protein [bacterium]